MNITVAVGSQTQTTRADERLRVCLAARDTVQARALCAYLAHEIGAQCAVYQDVEACFDAAALAHTPTVLLFDCTFMQPDEILRYLGDTRSIPQHVVPALLNVDCRHIVECDALNAGVRGFFYPNQDLQQLPKAVEALAHGEVWISRHVLVRAALHGRTQAAHDPDGRDRLTQRETEILAMIIIGARNDEIAEKLCISTNTVKTHIYNIYKKINVPNRTQAALWAAKHL